MSALKRSKRGHTAAGVRQFRRTRNSYTGPYKASCEYFPCSGTINKTNISRHTTPRRITLDAAPQSRLRDHVERAGVDHGPVARRDGGLRIAAASGASRKKQECGCNSNAAYALKSHLKLDRFDPSPLLPFGLRRGACSLPWGFRLQHMIGTFWPQQHKKQNILLSKYKQR